MSKNLTKEYVVSYWLELHSIVTLLLLLLLRLLVSIVDISWSSQNSHKINGTNLSIKLGVLLGIFTRNIEYG